MNDNWTSIKDGMPPKDGWYICSAESKALGKMVFVYKFEGSHWLTGADVIAWMPLPDFYDENSSESQSEDVISTSDGDEIAQEIVKKFF